MSLLACRSPSVPAAQRCSKFWAGGTVKQCHMKPPLSFASSNVYADQLRAEVSHLRRVLSSWLIAALICSALAGIGILLSGIIVGAELHKSGYIVGGILALLCLLMFGALQEAWGVVGILLSLLEFDDAISREDILKKLTNYMQKHTSAKRTSVIPENSDFDAATLHTMEGLPVKLLEVLTRALQAVPAAVSIASVVCAVVIFLYQDVPDQVSALPIVFASLATCGAVCGCFVRAHAAVAIDRIAFEEMDFDKSSADEDHRLHDTAPLRATLLELYMNMLRRKLASTLKGPPYTMEGQTVEIRKGFLPLQRGTMGNLSIHSFSFPFTVWTGEMGRLILCAQGSPEFHC